MSDSERGWSGRIREVGEAFLALVRAELRALADDLVHSGRGLFRGLLLLAVAGSILFWCVALVLDLLVELLSMLMPRWGAMAVVLVALVGVAIGLGARARGRLRGLETPAETLRRRLEESRGWWRARIEEADAAEDEEEDR